MPSPRLPALDDFRRAVDALNAMAGVATLDDDEAVAEVCRATEAVLGFRRVSVHPPGTPVPGNAVGVPLGGRGSHATELMIAELAPGGEDVDADRLRLLRLFARRAKAVADARLQLLAERSRAFADGIVDAALDGIVSMTLDGRIAALNPAAETMFRISREAAVGRDLAELMIPPELHEAHRAGLAAAAAGHPSGRVLGQRIQVVAHRADGEPFPCEVAVNRIHVPGESPRFTAFMRDVSLAEGLRAERDVARHEVDHDELTGLLSRAGLHARLEALLAAHAGDEDRRAFAACADIDDFAAVNAAFGVEAGDQVLVAVAERLADFGAELLVSRTGSDEFVIAGCPTREQVDRLHTSTSEGPLVVRVGPDLELHVRISSGLAVSDGPIDAEALLIRARSAVPRAKQSASGRAWFTAGLDRPGAELTMARDLRRGFERGELELHYQPLVGAEDGVPAGFEALLRWRRPDGGFVPPAAFIPAAESSGLIEPIGEWVLHEACRQLVSWEQAGHPPVFVSVNVSPRQLRRGSLTHSVESALRASGAPPERLTLEVTETVMMLGTGADAVLRSLGRSGVRCALDDFGADYSSLSRLASLPVSLVKLDRSFLNGVPEDPSAARVAVAILELCRSLELDAVVEGVETEAQLEFARPHATLLQGFHLGRPAPPAAVRPPARSPGSR